jgi:hypothetical protein
LPSIVRFAIRIRITAKEQLASLNFVQNEIKRIESQLAIYKTAGISYSKALNDELNK